jgi:pilus assembly protein CpaB
MNTSYIAEGTRSLDDVAGSVVRAAISAGEPITDDRLIKKGDRGFLSAIMGPGTRAVTVQLQQNAGLGGLVLPGDHVDVVLTAVIPGNGAGDPEHRASETVLEDIRVLAIDQKMSDMSNETIMARSATLEVTPKQAEIIALVSDMGKLSLTLRAIAAGDDKPMSTNARGEPERPSVTWDNEATDLGLKPHSAPAAADADAKVDLVRGSVTKSFDFPKDSK